MRIGVALALATELQVAVLVLFVFASLSGVVQSSPVDSACDWERRGYGSPRGGAAVTGGRGGRLSGDGFPRDGTQRVQVRAAIGSWDG